MRGLTIEELSARCAKFGHSYIANYTTTKNKFLAKCSCGYEYETYLCNIEKGHKCSICSGGVRHNEDAIAYELNVMGLTILKPYVHSKHPVVYLCSCGGIGRTVLHKLRDGQRCGNCAENNWRSKFLAEGFEIICYNGARDITFRCVCGAIHNCQANNWVTQHKGCPVCKVKWNYNPNKIGRPSCYLWKKAVLIRDNCTCQLCGEDYNLHVHHIEAFSYRPELAEDITNGITLCVDCHRQLHALYGINVGKYNLMKHLKG